MTTQYDPRKIAIAIPARMKSSRLPGKPLVEVGGKPLLWHAWQAALACTEANVKLVVTDSRDIEQYCQQWKIPHFLSSQTHPTGTDRIAEAVFHHKQDCPSYQRVTHVINLQCDEPDITGQDLNRMAKLLQDTTERVVTFSAPLYCDREVRDRNAVKVLVDFTGHAIYFSRESLKAGRLHVGVYGIRMDALGVFGSLPQPPMEIAERLEQLRFLYAGIPIQMIHLDRPIRPINTPQDIEQWSCAAI
jgi:3-deoxy-manno-octulosonate cytidylyltransferase (CMP-KDO synthetase)